MADAKDDRISGLEVKLESMIEMYNQVHAERDQLQADVENWKFGSKNCEAELVAASAEIGALREERETLLTRITELEEAIGDALEQLRVLRQEIA